VISISAGALIILLIVIAVLCACRRRRRRSQTIDPAIHTTVVTVGDTRLSSMHAYDEISAKECPPTSATTVKQDPDYLHLPDPEKDSDSPAL